MRWIHLADIHYNPGVEKNRNTSQLRRKLLQYISNNGIVADEMFITGDFRNAVAPCGDEESLVKDTVDFIMGIAKSAGISDNSHIHIVPGNHDLTRSNTSPSIKEIRINYDVSDGSFSIDTFRQLISRFGFFLSIKNQLHSSDCVSSAELLPLHTYKCYSGYTVLYLNTSLTCGDNEDRGNLVIGNSELYRVLEEIKESAPEAPIIIIAHHAPELFCVEEKDAVEKLFADYNVLFYLCGDAHKITCRKVNNVLEYTTGCMTFDKEVQVTFAYGELSGNTHNVTAHFWDAHSMCWGLYDPFNRYYEKISAFVEKAMEVKTTLDDNWFQKQNDTQISNLGQRYLPDVNISTGTERIFNSIARNRFFTNKFTQIADVTIQLIRKIKIAKFEKMAEKLIDEVSSLDLSGVKAIACTNLSKKLQKTAENIDGEINNELILNKPDNNKIYYLQNAINALEEFIDYLSSDEFRLANTPFCIISGEGGAGKSHLIADAVTKRNDFHEKSILLLGQHFIAGELPFNQIVKLLNISCSVDEMLNQFNEIGKQQSTRFIIFIDALNEGSGISIWKQNLQAMIENLKSYPWIGLVVSVRSHYIASLYKETNLKKIAIEIEHKGFSTVNLEAAKRYFEHYNIVYNNIPLSIGDFQNPLFLRLFCEGYHSRSISSTDVSLSQIYGYYLDEINSRISEKCMYNESIKAVEEAITSIVSLKYKENESNNYLPINMIVEAIIHVEKKYNLRAPLLDELLSVGIITKNINPFGEERIFITYEKLEDFLYSKILVDSVLISNTETFAETHKFLLNRGDVLEFLTVLLAENTNYEIFEIFTEDLPEIRAAFVNSLKWRNSSSITEKSISYINEHVLHYQDGFDAFMMMLVLLSTKTSNPLNADRTAKYVMGVSMPDRDAEFIEVFNKAFYGDDSPINVLLEWCLNSSEKASSNTVLLASKMVALFLISPNRALRDKSTMALVNLLVGKTELLITLLDFYKSADDPYILERLYAVTFGCIVREIDHEKIRTLAVKVYNIIFNNQSVFPNILLRDFAKNTIDYAFHVLGDIDIDRKKTTPPYNTAFPRVPDDNEIKLYYYNFEQDSFKDHYRSQNAIIQSMRVEYTRDGSPGGYGDFGRYVFQNYFRDWKNLNPNDLMNIAIRKIFDMGYDVEKHGEYDRKLSKKYPVVNRGERIGKKYQWIALYELAAQVADNFSLEQHVDDHGTTIFDYCKGSFEPSIRNIDPTIRWDSFNSDKEYRPIHEKLYITPNTENTKWVVDFSDIPNISHLTHTDYQNKAYVLLNGWYTWTEEKQLGFQKYELPQKDMWINVNSYIVKKDQLANYIRKLSNKNFMGRWLAEPHDSSMMFNRECYWSTASKFVKNPYYCGEELVDIASYDYEYEELEKVIVPTYRYYTERSGDTIGGGSCSWYKPCDTLFHNLDMQYGTEDTILYDFAGNVICFDSQELLEEDIGFFIDEKQFIKFLKQNDYACFWAILGEKRIIGENASQHEKRTGASVSGIYYLDESNNFIGQLHDFTE